MEIRKRYIAFQVDDNDAKYDLKVGDELQPTFSYGRIGGYYDCREYPTTTFDTEEQAIKYAWETSKHGDWVILPVIDFIDCWD